MVWILLTTPSVQECKDTRDQCRVQGQQPAAYQHSLVAGIREGNAGRVRRFWQSLASR
jgi:hypothetical protein